VWQAFHYFNALSRADKAYDARERGKENGDTISRVAVHSKPTGPFIDLWQCLRSPTA